MIIRARRLAFAVIVAIATVSAGVIARQEKPAADTVKPSTPLKITVVISRLQGDKKVGSLPFVMTVNSGDRTSVRMGADVPVPQGPAKEGGSSYQYRPVGTQIDVRASPTWARSDGRVDINLTVSDSQVSVNNAAEAGAMRGLPAFQQFTSTATLSLRDGQTMEYTAATDKLTGEVIRLEVTLNVLK
jgi:Flp pilus assembly secretin CpaC